ncbi:MAG: NADP-dependent oxidoreductase [Patiriisocius sp.]|uniref:NADP-dependent oxidoreductase n=1 Tax=Patiriisocius sp. TaxID=2822396 RepID=UPI003EF55757
MLPWKLQQSHSGKGLQKVDEELAPLSAYLGVLGLTGITAYVGLTNIGDLKKGETLLVSGASGAVGSVVGQIGKIKGCNVVGIAGSNTKVDLMKGKFGFNKGINYKTTKDMKTAIKEACPNGVDVYFDNVGGEILDAALANINRYGRVINCGAISLYNKTETPTGPRHETILVKKSVKMQGFIVSDFQDQFEETTKQLGRWLQEGKLTYSETVKEGFDNIPNAFMGLFEGENEGKMVVKI